jgi:hypothetical protein
MKKDVQDPHYTAYLEGFIEGLTGAVWTNPNGLGLHVLCAKALGLLHGKTRKEGPLSRKALLAHVESCLK